MIAEYTPTTYDDCIALAFRRLRLGIGMSQAVLAKKVGVPQATVSYWESGKRTIPFIEAMLICNALNTDAVHVTRKADFIAEQRGIERGMRRWHTT
jgi:transcriptional regulator with XRE-family HTH domain